jgi:hypothetical protein
MEMVKEVRRQFKEIPGIMEGTAKPEYEKCVEISTKASIREMIAPGSLALIAPVVVGFAFGPEALGGLLAGITVSGVLMGMFQNNAGGAWDNAKKSFEKGVEIDGKMEYKGSEPHKASVTGDTVGDPFKDTSGPSMNILIKLTSIVALIIAPHIVDSEAHHNKANHEIEVVEDRHIEESGNKFVVNFQGKNGIVIARHVMADLIEGGRRGTIELILDEASSSEVLGIGGSVVFHGDGEAIDGNNLRYRFIGEAFMGDAGSFQGQLVLGYDQDGRLTGDLTAM